MSHRPVSGAAAVLEPPPAAAARPAPSSLIAAREEPLPERFAREGADYDMLVIGGGPGGYVAAIRGSQLGLKVGLVEKDALGGTCLNVGCIPTKAMLSSVEALATARHGREFGFRTGEVTPDLPAMVQRRDRIVQQLRGGVGMLLKKNAVDVFNGTGRLLGRGEVEVRAGNAPRRVTARNVIIATGSVPSRPPIPGAELEGVVNSDGILKLTTVPGRLAVIGAGAVGLEWGDIFNELGSKVTILEMEERVVPPADPEVSVDLGRALEKKGLRLQLGVQVEGIERQGSALSVRYTAGSETHAAEVDVVLVATGRWSYTDGLGLDAVGLETTRRSIEVDETLRTKVPGIFAIGDVTPAPQLAHVASKGGEVAAEVIAGHRARIDYRHIPSCIYTHPEVAWAGLTEIEARRQYPRLRVGKVPFRVSGRALAGGYRDGWIKVIADEQYGEILGVHMIGARVTDLIAEAVLAMSLEATVDEVIHAVHAHPTLPEIFFEATLDAWDRAIHKG